MMKGRLGRRALLPWSAGPWSSQLTMGRRCRHDEGQTGKKGSAIPWPAGWAMGGRCRHDCAEGRQESGVVSDGCTNMIASDVLPESRADPAASALTAGRKLRWWRDLHSFRWCRSPIGNLRMMWSKRLLS